MQVGCQHSDFSILHLQTWQPTCKTLPGYETVWTMWPLKAILEWFFDPQSHSLKRTCILRCPMFAFVLALSAQLRGHVSPVS